MVSQATGLSTAFSSPDLVATIFLPKNEAFLNLVSLTGMTVDQALASEGTFAPFLGQVGSLALGFPWALSFAQLL